MIVGHHLVWTAYGCWLPNDPRGSSSHEVRVPAIAQLGELHYGRKKAQPSRAELREFHREAKAVLAHPVLGFDADDVAVLAGSFRDAIRKNVYTCYACAIMPDHVHMLIRVHRDRPEKMIERLQVASRDALIAAGRRRGNHPVWGGPGWKTFQDSREAMRRIARYVENNPRERNLPEQHWDFVVPYDGWLPYGARH